MFPKIFWKHYNFLINMIENMNVDDNTKTIKKLFYFHKQKSFRSIFQLAITFSTHTFEKGASQQEWEYH